MAMLLKTFIFLWSVVSCLILFVGFFCMLVNVLMSTLRFFDVLTIKGLILREVVFVCHFARALFFLFFRTHFHRVVFNARSRSEGVFTRLNVKVIFRDVLNNGSTERVIIANDTVDAISYVETRVVVRFHDRVIFRRRLILRVGGRLLYVLPATANERVFRGRLRLLGDLVNTQLIRAEFQDVRRRYFS